MFDKLAEQFKLCFESNEDVVVELSNELNANSLKDELTISEEIRWPQGTGMECEMEFKR